MFSSARRSPPISAYPDSWPCVRNPIRSAAQVAAFASVALYAAFYVGEAKLKAATLYADPAAGASVAALALQDVAADQARVVHRRARCVHPDRHAAGARCEAAQCAGAGRAALDGP